MNKKEIIKDFLTKIREEQFIPEYCHNLKSHENKVFYSGPLFDDDELVEAIDSLLFGKWLSSGEKVAKFENEFSKHIKQKYSVMLNSGSSANLVLIASLKKYFNWKDGDEIILSVVGFPTTLNPILQNNLKPVFVDIEYDTLNFDLNEVEKKITPLTRAIFISPVLGNPPDMDRLVALSKKYHIELILDGCDSLGSKWNGEELSNFCIASSCSFYPAHHLCTGEGGMVSSNVEKIIDYARSFSWWGRDCYCIGASNLLKNGTCNCRFSQWIKELPYPIDHKYFFTNIGYNLKPLDLQGGIGLAQLKKIEKFHEIRKSNKEAIQKLFVYSISGLSFPTWYSQSDVSWFGVPIICKSHELKSKIVAYLEKHGIQTRNYFAGNILLHPAYKELEDWKNYPNATSVLEKVFFVGCSPTIVEKDIEYIESVIKNYE